MPSSLVQWAGLLTIYAILQGAALSLVILGEVNHGD